MAHDQSDLLQGTLELMLLKTPSLDPVHGSGESATASSRYLETCSRSSSPPEERSGSGASKKATSSNSRSSRVVCETGADTVDGLLEPTVPR